MATLTTVVVFLPLILMSDDQNFSFWMLRIGVPVIVGLLASLLIALVIIPLATQRLASSSKNRESRMIARWRGWYLSSLRWVLNRRLDALILFILAMASIQIPAQGMGRTDQDHGNRRSVYLSFEMPSGQSLSQADAFMSSVEDTLMNHRVDYAMKNLRVNFNRNSGRAEIVFAEDEDREWYEVAYQNLLDKLGLIDDGILDYKEVAEDVKERIYRPPGVKMRVNWERVDGGSDVAVRLYGEDTAVLVTLSREVERRLESVTGIQSVETEMDRGVTELQVHLDRDRLQRFGLDAQMVSRNIAYGLQGSRISRFQTESGEELDIWIELEKADRTSIQDLRELVFPTVEGREIPLESMASLFVEPGLGNIRREDRRTALKVTATAEEEDAGELFQRVDAAMQGFEMPRGYSWDKGERNIRLDEADQSQQFALMLSAMFVFLLMGVLFESFVLPLSVIVSIPFAFLGVFWLLFLTGTSYDMMSMIGTVILVGIVVNNAIVLIDLTNRLRNQGMERMEALMEAGKHRFRPILMTSFTTMCGLIPMAAGNSKMVGMPYAPLGRTMIGGLFASMILTLVVVPLCYTFFDDARLFLRRISSAAVERG